VEERSSKNRIKDNGLLGSWPGADRREQARRDPPFAARSPSTRRSSKAKVAAVPGVSKYVADLIDAAGVGSTGRGQAKLDADKASAAKAEADKKAAVDEDDEGRRGVAGAAATKMIPL
jgi:hypothetical protein